MIRAWKKGGLSVKVMFSLPGVATQILVSGEGDEIDLLLDCGSGTLRDLLLEHYRNISGFDRIRAVLVSHEHFDHVGGLYPLLDFMHMIGREKPLDILVPGPSTVAKSFVDALMDFRRSLTYSIDLIEVSGGEELSYGAMKVKAFPVVHRGSMKKEPIGPYIPAVGYSISYRGIRVVYSGDTGLCRSLADEVRGADLAILEATWKRRKDHAEIHMSEEEATELGRKAKDFLLIHRLRDLELFIELSEHA